MLVTVIGWLFVFSGLARMLFVTRLAALAARMGQNIGFLVGIAVVLLAVGGFLSFKA